MRAERAQQAAAIGVVRHPAQRARHRGRVAVEKQLDRAQLELADVAVRNQLPDVGPLRRVTKFMRDHRGQPGLGRGIAHLDGLPDVDGERFFAQHVLACVQLRDRQLVVSAGRRDDRDGVDVIAADQLDGIGMNACDAGIGCGFFGLFPVAAADRHNLPAFGAKARDVHLRPEPDAYDPYSVFRRRQDGLRWIDARFTWQIDQFHRTPLASSNAKNRQPRSTGTPRTAASMNARPRWPWAWSAWLPNTITANPASSASHSMRLTEETVPSSMPMAKNASAVSAAMMSTPHSMRNSMPAPRGHRRALWNFPAGD